MSGPVVSALVVLRTTGTSAQLTAARLQEVAPEPGVVDQVRSWFAAHGFEVGPFVGISFAVTAPADLFREQLGADPAQASRAGGDLDIDRSRLDPPVADAVDAVAFTTPPDFGPGNP